MLHNLGDDALDGTEKQIIYEHHGKIRDGAMRTELILNEMTDLAKEFGEKAKYIGDCLLVLGRAKGGIAQGKCDMSEVGSCAGAMVGNPIEMVATILQIMHKHEHICAIICSAAKAYQTIPPHLLEFLSNL